MDRNEELVWMAGIIDGEGCITIRKYLRKHALHPQYWLALILNVVRGQDVSMFPKRFSGRIYPIKAPTNRSRPYNAWVINCKMASDALKELLPYLVWKKEKAELAIGFQECIKPGRRALSAGDVEERERFYLAMKKLNLRGRVSAWEPEAVDIGGGT